jgi:hypothetical protein
MSDGAVLETPVKRKPRVGDGTPGPGRPKGIVDRRTDSGRKVAQALAARAWDVVEKMLDSSSPLDGRLRLDAAKIVLEYAHGKPRQSVDIDLRDRVGELAASNGITAGELLATAAEIVAAEPN